MQLHPHRWKATPQRCKSSPGSGLWLLFRPVRRCRWRRGLRHHRHAKYGQFADPGYVLSPRLLRVGQVEGLAMLAAVYFRIVSITLPHVPASLLDHIRQVKPAFQVPAAEFPLGVLLVTGTLQRLLVFHFVVRQLSRRIVWLISHDDSWALGNGSHGVSKDKPLGPAFVTAHCNAAQSLGAPRCLWVTDQQLPCTIPTATRRNGVSPARERRVVNASKLLSRAAAAPPPNSASDPVGSTQCARRS